MKSAITYNNISLAKKVSDDVNKKFHLLMFLIWPLMGFIVACRDFSSRFNRNMILAFYTLYGFTFYISPAMDGQRYASHLEKMYSIPTENYDEIFEGLFSDGGQLDILQPLITFIVSRFTSYYSVLFAVFAFILGTIQLKTIYMLYQDAEKKFNSNVIILLWFLPFLLSIFSINGFRMWTAAWFFMYGVYNYTYRKKRIYLLVALSTAFIHFSFITVNIVFLIYAFAGNRRLLFTILAIASFMFSELPLPAIQTYVENFGSGITRKFTSYTHEKYSASVQESTQHAAWFIRWSGPLLKYFLCIAIGSMYFRLRNVKFSKEFNSLWCVTLLILTYANLASLVPSGGRFLTVFFLISIALLIIFYAHYYTAKKIDTIILVGIFPMALFALVAVRVGLSTTNLSLILPTPVIAIFTNNGLPIMN